MLTSRAVILAGGEGRKSEEIRTVGVWIKNSLAAHIAPRGAKKEEAFGGVILKSERPSGALFTNSGPPFFTVESKIEVLSPLGTSFH